MSRPHPARIPLFPFVVLVLIAACGRPGQGPASSAPAQGAAPAAPAPPPRSALSAEERQALVGWWLRYDQSYMIVIDAVAEDGRLTARYLNPDPVGVSKAAAWKVGERVELLLELTDENYPGNFYELSFDPAQQKLVGVYHHLGAREDYEVDFTRFEDEGSVAVRP